MKIKILFILLFMFLFAYMAFAQSCSTYNCHTADKNGKTGAHNFQRSDGTDKSPCAPCHKPHNAGDKIPLWNTVNKFDDGVAYSAYTSPTDTLDNIPSSNVYAGTEACMSCHDGMSESTGFESPYFQNYSMGTMHIDYSNAQHPIGMNYDSKVDAGLSGNVVSGNVVGNIGKYKLVSGKVECITCHDPHKKGSPGKDYLMYKFYSTIPNDEGKAVAKLLRSSSVQKFCNECHQNK